MSRRQCAVCEDLVLVGDLVVMHGAETYTRANGEAVTVERGDVVCYAPERASNIAGAYS